MVIATDKNNYFLIFESLNEKYLETICIFNVITGSTGNGYKTTRLVFKSQVLSQVNQVNDLINPYLILINPRSNQFKIVRNYNLLQAIENNGQTFERRMPHTSFDVAQKRRYQKEYFSQRFEFVIWKSQNTGNY
ncbi:hypothetical protein BpHYR1_050770 [Brachionus plicatilis]|uniref:Uncharacterized protein n=1 Tax=Brachionus plicatilis TaxID=10195 RepID=A0A3M7PAI0_BRAPC|nr:hypothetical protein BpHYR1_050770 [Brachionus plicatilis]